MHKALIENLTRLELSRPLEDFVRNFVSQSRSKNRQSGDSNSEWHKKNQKVPVGESACLGKSQLGDRLEKFNPWTHDFFLILWSFVAFDKNELE